MTSHSAYHVQQMERLGSDFFADGDGLRTVARRTEVVDDIVRSRFDEVFGAGCEGIAAVAVGGYGRSELFPHSDIDLLLLFRRHREAIQLKDKIADLLVSLWDSKLRMSHSVRDPSNCTTLAPNNTELHISLLDTRFIGGDSGFFSDFNSSTLPRFYLREQKELLRSLAASARKRHHSFDDTLYHLEPDVKEGPGGLRDYHLACWESQLVHVEPNRIPTSEEFLPKDRGWDIGEAKRFLFATRCFLHYYYCRDKNLLNYDMQDTIASAGAGKLYEGDGDVADMMREFYRNTRSMYRLALRLMDESAAPSSALLAMFRKRKARLSNQDFAVLNGRIFFKDTHALESTPRLSLGIFEFQARHGVPVAAETERRIRNGMDSIRGYLSNPGPHWSSLREILLLPHAYQALEAMRETGVLYSLFPEFELVDCLVIRDFYHRYTVDEHTLMTVRILKELPDAPHQIDQRYARLLGDVERLDLLYFALLFHDIGKGVKGSDHSESSADLAEKAMHRIGLDDPLDRDTVLYLVRDHLSMSEVMTKRDLAEPTVLEEFQTRVGTVERLKLLTLLTYADTVAVNPTSVTNWRKELLWRLYRGTDAIFQRDHEDARITPDIESGCLELAVDDSERQRMRQFLRGFPQRYLRTQEPVDVYQHFTLSKDLAPGRSIVRAKRSDGHFDVVVLAWDRRFLFASLCAAIGSFGFNIEHAEAFSNEAGIVLDSYYISTGPEGPSPDIKKIEQRLRRIADGSIGVRDLSKGHYEPRRRRSPDPPQVSFDNELSERATIFYVRASDRARLLYDLANTFSRHDCDIDVVLCHTQGHHASDVFYVRRSSAKLAEAECETLQAELLEACKA